MASIFCCGFECGGTPHMTFNNATVSTTIFRTGLRSARVNLAASAFASNITFPRSGSIGGTLLVARGYVYFTTLPDTNFPILSTRNAASGTINAGAIFQSSDGKIYPAMDSSGTLTLGANGFAVTTDRWYRIDVRVNVIANPWLIDVMVDGNFLTQASIATGATTITSVMFGRIYSLSSTTDMYFDDLIVSTTTGDYPFGAGYVNNFVPTADGTHNVAGTNDFEVGTGGVDIVNATTTAWQLVDDVPLQTGLIGTTDFINMVLPVNATDYVECIFGPAPGVKTPTYGPRGVEAITGIAGAGGAANNMEVRLNDNGTNGVIYTHTGVTLSTNITFGRAHFADPPSAASVWTVVSGNGNFNDVRVRFGSPAALDVTPDPYFAGVMIEAEFVEWPQKIIQVKQAINRASTY